MEMWKDLQSHTKVLGELSKEIMTLASKTSNLEKTVQTLQDPMQRNKGGKNKEIRREQEKMAGEAAEQLKELMADNLALIELRQKKMLLRFRSMPHQPDKVKWDKIIEALASMLEMQKQDLAIDHVLWVKSPYAKKTQKLPGDCLVLFNSKIECFRYIMRKVLK